MRIPRIFHPEPLSVGADVNLTADAFQHVVKVLRMSAGQAVCFFNGDGNDYPAELNEVEKRSARALVTGCVANTAESPTKVHLGQVISRGDRMDFALQKSVELGVTEITPLFSERCGVKLSGERLQKKQQQWQKVVISACEQCGRSSVPTVQPAVSLDEFAKQSFDGLKLTLDPTAQKPLAELASNYQDCRDIRLVIGPEGGFTEHEVALASAQGFNPMRLGPRILRTETAALTALSIIQYQLGDLA
ncbi:16S rRNA (uracil(1498)-N(3))-methyltransferase [Idiomarina seosinensis]|uniref:Ribosomal RNA small subunit methyltransferase E n=1 Tax=Idiomarina seosinensis TaxID=281739 RepID=A0A432ZB93_9GAMM|nr:16S rRNA (uracil(1498)-N(3))-methyltransferase [Idiomarina seosinensis]RUO75208.1 16S rRNA (uracil(1498)-N(3))-methyltransferase [Idiomarina seosinensis]